MREDGENGSFSLLDEGRGREEESRKTTAPLLLPNGAKAKASTK